MRILDFGYMISAIVPGSKQVSHKNVINIVTLTLRQRSGLRFCTKFQSLSV